MGRAAVKKLLVLVAAAFGVLAVPGIAVVAAIGVAGTAVACINGAGGALSPSAPVPVHARLWIALTHAECPDLPESWIAAVMAEESRFRPDAYADDSSGGTWGLFQLNAAVWRATYGAPWESDLNRNGVWDVRDANLHAATAGKYLCGRLNVVRAIRDQHPEWVSTRELSELDALVVAHNAGESHLATYPAIPRVTADFVRNVDARVESWSTCLDGVGAVGSVAIALGTPQDVTSAIRTSLSYVGVRYGWARKCDRLVCRAYGFANSGYITAAAHWQAMVGGRRAHPRDRCPPVGSFLFWDTRGPGHVALVVQADPACDPNRIKLVSNDVMDAATGNHGGVYLVTLTQIEDGFVRAASYLGWSDPVCAGVPLPPGTRHPTA
jgi:hypothetical protein